MNMFFADYCPAYFWNCCGFFCNFISDSDSAEMTVQFTTEKGTLGKIVPVFSILVYLGILKKLTPQIGKFYPHFRKILTSHVIF